MSNNPESNTDLDPEAVEAALASPTDDESSEELAVVVPEGFSVKDEESANWVIRKITSARDRIARMKDSKKRADTEIKSQKQTEEFFLERYSSQLSAFASTQLDGKRKSVKLLEGVLGFRTKTVNAHLNVTDEKAAVEWVKANLPEAAVTVTEVRIDLPTVMKHFKETGEEPPGIVFVPEEVREEFYVK